LASLIAEVAAYHDTRRQVAQARAAHTAHRLVRDRTQSHPPGGPPRGRGDSRRPDPTRAPTPEDRGVERAARVEAARVRAVEIDMTRRAHGGRTDDELAAELAQAQHSTGAAATAAQRLRQDIAALEPAVTGGQGPRVSELATTLGQLRRCTALHERADGHQQRADAAAAQRYDLGRRGVDLRNAALYPTARVRLPGQQKRLLAEAHKLRDQADGHRVTQDSEQARCRELRAQAAQYGPGDPALARTQLHQLDTTYPARHAHAQRRDQEQLRGLYEQLEQTDEHTDQWAGYRDTLTHEQQVRAQMPTGQRAVEDHIRASTSPSEPSSPADEHTQPDRREQLVAAADAAEQANSPAGAVLRAMAALTPPTTGNNPRAQDPRSPRRQQPPPVIKPYRPPAPGRGRGR